MKSRGLILAAFGAAALLVAACGGGDTIIHSSQNATGISATGFGRVFAEPDVSIVTVGVNVERETVEEAREAAAGAQQSVIDALRANGIAQEDIQTVRFSVNPRYDNRTDADQRRIVGYVVRNVVTATIRDLDTTGQVIDDATRAAGDDAVVQGVSFTIDDPSELFADARRLAVEEAREQAQQLADAANANLGPLLSLSSDSGGFPSGRAEMAMDMLQTDTPIEPGEVEVTVYVNAVYALE